MSLEAAEPDLHCPQLLFWHNIDSLTKSVAGDRTRSTKQV